uniref:Uncharacterized protein n=1 Tax=Oryza punctata TaxID=4537 RepID=A0A0E0KHA6_ORYPU
MDIQNGLSSLTTSSNNSALVTPLSWIIKELKTNVLNYVVGDVHSELGGEASEQEATMGRRTKREVEGGMTVTTPVAMLLS